MLSIIEEVSTITDRMLAAARQQDWDLLVELEKQCSGRIDILRAQESGIPLPEGDRQKKIVAIRKILDDDRQIREIVSPWMDHLSAFLRQANTERKLSQAYGMNRTG